SVVPRSTIRVAASGIWRSTPPGLNVIQRNSVAPRINQKRHQVVDHSTGNFFRQQTRLVIVDTFPLSTDFVQRAPQSVFGSCGLADGEICGSHAIHRTSSVYV